MPNWKKSKPTISPEDSASALALFAPNNNDHKEIKPMAEEKAIVQPMFDAEGNLLQPQGERVTIVENDGFVAWADEGANLTGIYNSRSRIKVEGGGEVWAYTFTTGLDPETGEAIEGRCNGTTKIDQAMDNIEPGSWVSITYNGTTKTNSGFTLKLFDVETVIAAA